VDHIKHRAVLLTLYPAGLRLTEATNLKAQQDPGCATPRSHDSDLLQDGDRQGSYQQACYAPHAASQLCDGLLEAGVDLMAISKLLGHSSFTTTMIYLHCRRQHLDSIPSPLDWLPVRQCPMWIDPSLEKPKPKSAQSDPKSDGLA